MAPTRNRIALQMVKDVLEEASFEAAPVRAVSGRIGQAASSLIDRLRNRAQNEHPEYRTNRVRPLVGPVTW
ncbi:hypothetical protein AB0L00_39440 [Actinoallomurus sp. NPDC052308]|uniref:hypothetical protein n=1 Tax=Actinoallomurus sp. NPDC052308 TaxID=3155530 RepID=UPI003449E5A7